ncbi:MAG: hypothetical protein LBU43_11895, partial [Candidatus Accumulibacter sp.]|nr:hypothetical protein [Accumulibacter sp.]
MLTSTTDTNVDIASGVTVTITGAVINPSATAATLYGQGSSIDTASVFLGVANDFITLNPDPADWGTYFASGRTFANAVGTAITAALSTASVIQGGNSQRAIPVILDNRGSTSSLNYQGLIFQNFDNVLASNCNTVVFCGGGIVGSYNGLGDSAVGTIDNSIFFHNRVVFNVYSSQFSGGGVVGASNNNATTGAITASLFTSNTIEITNDFTNFGGGGVVGASGNNATTGAITASLFTSNTIESHGIFGEIDGGGVVGASGDNATTGAITESLFTGNTINANGFLGGGVVGVMGSNNATIEAITESLFTGNTINSGGKIDGGGVVGAYSRSNSANASVVGILKSRFVDNTIKAENINGGGVVGAYARANSGTASVGNISKSLFTRNTIEATSGDLWGGLIYTADDLTLADSAFTDNTFTADGSFGGTVSIDVSKLGDGDAVHTVTLQASDGQTTLFQNNIATDTSGTMPNSLAFVNLQGGTSNADAVLNIEADTGGTVALYDPIKVVLNNKTFNMNVTGAGDFLWGGANSIGTDTEPGTINLNAGKTTLLNGFELDALKHDVHVNNTAALSFAGLSTLNVPSVTIASGGTLGMAAGSTLLAAPSAVTVASGAAMTIS